MAGNAKTRNNHKLEILNFIRKYSPVSRTGIFRRTNISKPTVTRIIKELLEEGFISETGTVRSGVGRSAVKLELNPVARYCIGMNITRFRLSVSLLDLNMNIIKNITENVWQFKNEEDFLCCITSAIEQMIDHSCIDKYLGIGVGVSGAVDFKNGILKDFAVGHVIMNIPLKQFIEEKFGLFTMIDNDGNTQALWEYWYGGFAERRDLILVLCGKGVGCGIIRDGKILRGRSTVNNEFGHMTVSIDGQLCRCGKTGCIEAYCSAEAIAKAAQQALEEGRASALMKIDAEPSCEAVYLCAEEGDPLCCELLGNAAEILSVGISTVVNLIGPEVVVLSGDLIHASALFYENVVEATKQRLFGYQENELSFFRRSTDNKLRESGAVAMIFEEFFSRTK